MTKVMRLLERFSEWFEQTILFEMAYARKDAWRICNGLGRQLANHIVKLIIMPESSFRLHWLQECFTFFDDMNNIYLKPQNRRLDYLTYKEWLVNEPERDPVRMAEIEHFYPNEKIVIPNNLQEIYLGIMEEICVRLSKNESLGKVIENFPKLR